MKYESLSEMIAHQDEIQRLAAAAYDATRKLGKLSSHRLLSYRCPRRCLLLDVAQFPAPVGVVLHTPGYKRSPTVNEATSTAAGRAANTVDGDRRWKAHTFLPEQAINVTLACDHVESVLLDLETVQADLDARRREVTVTIRRGNI